MKEHEKVLLEINNKQCEIDKECVDWVMYFNSVGLTTKFCCQGDDTAKDAYVIIFHDDVTDEQVYKFMKENYKIWGFYKWVRTGHINDTIYCNWVFMPKTINIAKELFESLIHKER